MFLCGRYAFGTATQVLPVPELMPFRLTRQLAGALAPYEATDVLQRPLACCLGALRNNAAVLQVTFDSVPCLIEGMPLHNACRGGAGDRARKIEPRIL